MPDRCLLPPPHERKAAAAADPIHRAAAADHRHRGCLPACLVGKARTAGERARGEVATSGLAGMDLVLDHRAYNARCSAHARRHTPVQAGPQRG